MPWNDEFECLSREKLQQFQLQKQAYRQKSTSRLTKMRGLRSSVPEIAPKRHVMDGSSDLDPFLNAVTVVVCE